MVKHGGRSRITPVWIVVVVAFIAVAAVFVQNAVNDGHESESGQFETSLRLKWLWYAGWAGELVAMNEGIWGQHGLSVRIEPGGFELDPIRIVASGTNDFGVAGADQILLAREKGIPLVAFATQYQVSPVGFVSKKSSQITSIEGFRGKKIGVKFGTDVEPVYRALLAKVGLSEDDLDEVPVKFDLTPFFSDVIDVYPGYLTNDLLFPEERGYEVNTIRATDMGVTVYGNVYFCTEDFLARNPDTVQRFFQAIRSAWIRALAMPPESVAELAIQMNDGLKLEHEIDVIQSLQEYIIPQGTSFGDMTDEGWANLYYMLREQYILKREFDYRSAYTIDVIQRAEP